jgi:hypothetical protein
MLTSYAVGLTLIVVVMVTWVGVQSAWRRVFADVCTDPDALAGRSKCHGCRGKSGCKRRQRESNETSEEGIR